MGISTHVLDAVHGRPAVGLAVRLAHLDGGEWVELASEITDGDGRIPALAAVSVAGVYRLTFATEDYLDVETFYPEVSITVRITDPAAHHHVPLLLSPYAYSTYRGS
jgi:5-hydroxyisourate hydrolase